MSRRSSSCEEATANLPSKPRSRLITWRRRELESASDATISSRKKRCTRKTIVRGNALTWLAFNDGATDSGRCKRRGQNAMPRGKVKDRDGIYRRKDKPGTWWGSWIDASGKRRQRKLEARTLQQARTLLSAEKARVEKTVTLGYAPPSAETFAAVSTRFLKHQKARLTPAADNRED